MNILYDSIASVYFLGYVEKFGTIFLSLNHKKSLMKLYVNKEMRHCNLSYR